MANKPISQLADEVLQMVDDAHLSKTASVVYTNEMKTDTGRGLKKLASLVREEANSPISYEDLANFRKNHGL